MTRVIITTIIINLVSGFYLEAQIADEKMKKALPSLQQFKQILGVDAHSDSFEQFRKSWGLELGSYKESTEWIKDTSNYSFTDEIIYRGEGFVVCVSSSGIKNNALDQFIEGPKSTVVKVLLAVELKSGIEGYCHCKPWEGEWPLLSEGSLYERWFIPSPQFLLAGYTGALSEEIHIKFYHNLHEIDLNDNYGVSYLFSKDTLTALVLKPGRNFKAEEATAKWTPHTIVIPTPYAPKP